MKAIAVLAHHMDANGVLGRESIARLETAVHLDNEIQCDLFLTTGWAYRRDCTKKIGMVMAEQLVARFNIDNNRIIVDDNARDTVGDAFFLRRNAIVPQGINEVFVVTSDYHAARAEQIFKAMLSPEVKVQSVGADVGLGKNEKLLQHEENSLRSFNDTFAGVDFADDTSVCRTLRTKHPFYNGVVHPKLECA